MPEGLPLPKLILSKRRLRKTWDGSRDATAKPAKPGIDSQTALSFAHKLDANIDRLHQELMERRFHFSSLKAAIIPKEGGKSRVICIPTVRDRLVQRTILAWLVEKKSIPHQDFVYGAKGGGVKTAIDRAIQLRETFDYCIKSDIQSFFDKISRPKIKALVESNLRNSSVLPLLLSVINLELKPRNSKQASEIAAAGIVPGIGIRQGMPLSPLLANFSLTHFDAACKKNNIKILRYADDILAFFRRKEEAKAGFGLIKEALKQLELYVPEIGEAKTEQVAKGNPVTFLGREIVSRETLGKYVSRVGDKKLKKIQDTLTADYTISDVMEENGTLDNSLLSLSASIRSYLGAYKDADDFAHFQNEMRAHYKKITRGWFQELFGVDALEKLSDKQRRFLGIQISQGLDPIEDIELT